MYFTFVHCAVFVVLQRVGVYCYFAVSVLIFSPMKMTCVLDSGQWAMAMLSHLLCTFGSATSTVCDFKSRMAPKPRDIGVVKDFTVSHSHLHA